MKKKMLFVIAIMVAFTLFVPSVWAAEIVTSAEQFVTAVEEGKSVEIRKNLEIKLQKDITVTNKVTIGVSSGQEASVTIDLNGHKINLDGSNAQLYVQTKGKLIVNDTVGNGLITTGESTTSPSYSIHIKGSCEINGGTLENTVANKYTLYIQDKTSTCTLNNGTIINSYDKGGKAVYNKGTFVMNGGKVVNKAAGNPGYAAAIEGQTIIMNGGEIEAAGTGIVATGSTVEITGGTINAGWYGLLTRYATINPAEGKQINIKAGKAIVAAYSAPSGGIGNKIYGGNFDAPILVKGYSSETDATNIEVHGGTFTHDVSKNVVDGKYVEKVGANYEVKEYTQNVEVTPVNPDEKVENTTIGLTQSEGIKNTLMESLEEEITSNPALQDVVKNNHVVVGVGITSIKENELNNEVINKFEEVSKDLVIADYFDISVLVNDNNNNKLGSIHELTKEIELVIVLPEKYVNMDKNINRTYYVIREHDGKVEILKDIEVSEDGKSIIFKSNKFSTYALAYEDKVIKNQVIEDESKEELPPKTGDINLLMLIGTILVSSAGIVIASKKISAKSN